MIQNVTFADGYLRFLAFSLHNTRSTIILKKFISLFLSVFLLTISIVGAASSDDSNSFKCKQQSNEYEYENEQYYEKEIREKKQISSEFKIVSLREEYVKHFAQGEQIE